MRPTLSAGLAALLLSAGIAGAGELKLGTPFSDHMVLQREKPVPVWGRADAGEAVTVRFAGQEKSATADADGRWRVTLDPLTADAEPRTLTVTGGAAGRSREVGDVLVGEVWLGSGQSNMVFGVSRGKDAEAEIAAAKYPQIRLFREESHGVDAPQAEGTGAWVACSPETVGQFSAALYFFGRELHEELDVPVGLMVSAVGGTPIEAWISPEAQRSSAPLAPFLKQFDATAAEGPSPEVQARYERALARWQAEAEQARAEGKEAPRRPRNPTAPARLKPNLGGLFNGKIAPLVPFALRGVLWYQGEANTLPEKAEYYQYQLPLLVKDWRARWGDELPFAWVQLPNFTGTGRDLPTVREAMRKTLSLPKTGMAVTIDIGDDADIHPKNKQDVGHRLALWALGTVYGRKVESTSGPLPKAYGPSPSGVTVHFAHADGGLKTSDGGETVTGFEFKTKDGAWRPTTATIKDDSVHVVCPSEDSWPTVRYGWANSPRCNLVNGAGLPASPFTAPPGWIETF